LSGDVTAWNELDLRTESGGPINESDRETILDDANKALQNGDHDPKRILQAARRVGRRAHLVENLRAYAMRAIFRAKRPVDPAQLKEEPLSQAEAAAELTDRSQVDQIENRILVRELLDTLSPHDQEIFLRRMAGDTFAEIDSGMNLRPRTAESRFCICKNALRKVLQEKLDRKTCARGC
jgi:DNA-directed RNA polymerase specialized sigma24 family protein